MIKGAAILVRASGLDQSVHVNNWLFSTNPAPEITDDIAAEIRDRLVARFPSHAIILRSLNTHSDQDTLKALEREGFQILPSRQIYIFDVRAPDRLSKDMKNDRALLRKTDLLIVYNDSIHQQDYTRCIALYDQLYLDKYTPLNPQYTATYLAEMHQAGLLYLQASALREIR